MRLPDSWSKSRVTLAISVLTALAYLVVTFMGIEDRASVWGGFIPGRLTFGGDEMLAPFWVTPLLSTLFHGGLIHLGFNLLMLVFCGRPVEAVLGPVGLLILYLVGAYAAAGAQYLVDPTSAVVMIGASGAISAVLGAYAMLFGRNKVKIANPTLALWLNALWLMAAWVGLQLVVGFTFAQQGISVAIAAHIGGFLVGILLANPLLLLRYRKA